jgi:uncharacterized protein HemY
LPNHTDLLKIMVEACATLEESNLLVKAAKIAWASGDKESARTLVMQIQKLGRSKDDGLRDAMAAQIAMGDLDGAYATAQKMRPANRANSLRQLINAYAKLGNFSAVLALAERLDASNMNDRPQALQSALMIAAGESGWG